MLVYKQITGEILKNTLSIGKGYSGHEDGLNNTQMEMIPYIGPIPRGTWEIGIWFDDKHLGPCVAALKPLEGTNVFGRGGFFIHGDNKLMNHSASEGCIILSRNLREQIKVSKEKYLIVKE